LKVREFDAIRFCEDYGIDYWTEGKNVSPGWVSVGCPFCGDTSNHGAFNPVGGYFNCWKCGGHSLYDTVKAMSGENHIKPILEKYGFLSQIPTNNTEEKLKPNENFEVPGGPLKQPHKDYLIGRGFDPDYIERKYSVKGTLLHKTHPYRIITPVFWEGEPVSFLGRDYTGKQTLRHKDCSIEYSKIYHKTILYGMEHAMKDKVIVVEGAYDKWRIGDDSVATLGTGWTTEQMMLLAKNYEEVFILFDLGEIAQKKARDLAIALNALGIYSEVIRTDYEEPDDMLVDDIKHLKRELGI
jgi:5S rRNA maturation endonuclease (ribonuclease M5)